MITPKEKAIELANKYYSQINITTSEAKHCALIAIDDIINELTKSVSPSVHGFRHNYWEEVKKEIEKL